MPSRRPAGLAGCPPRRRQRPRSAAHRTCTTLLLGRLTAALSNQACGLLGAWSAGGGERLVDVSGSPMRSGVLAAAGALEIAVHGWDVGVACGLDHPIPDALAADLCAYLPLLVQSSDRPQRFGPRLPVPAGASHAVRLLAELGRRGA